MMHYDLPKLPYSYDALEPFIDAETMEIHHLKHHAGYIEKLNAALEHTHSYRAMPLTELPQNLGELPRAARKAIRRHGGGHVNHSLFWKVLCPPDQSTDPTKQLEEELIRDFESVDLFKKTFTSSALSLFGSGWTWLCVDSDNRLTVTNSANQDNPLLFGLVPILGIDLWEHAYYLKYRNRRAEYIDACWNILNWEQVARNYEEVSKHSVLAVHA